MTNKISIAMLATVILITFAGCGQIQTAQCEKSKTADTSSASVTSDTEISDDAAAESSSSAVDSEIPTEIETTVPAPEPTAKVSTQKTAQPSVSAKKDTQKKQSEPFENTGVKIPLPLKNPYFTMRLPRLLRKRLRWKKLMLLVSAGI